MHFKKFDTINVIPFIDIMLVLLAIVLTTATFIANGELDITLPEANAQHAQTDPNVIEITIDENAHIFLKGQPVDLDELRRRLQTASADSPVTLSVDENTAFQHFVAVVDLLRELSLEKLSIITRQTG